MIAIRPSSERGHADHGWLDTRHTFSFAGYHDPDHMGLSDLRVINEDFVRPGHGFPMHLHRDMEILTYVLKGVLSHEDSLGNGSVIVPGEIQRMTAGTGVRHSEFNASSSETLHLLQIWIQPGQPGLPPGYEQKAFDDLGGTLRLIASPDASDGSVTIHQDARVYATVLEPGQTATLSLSAGRRAWVQVARGTVDLNGHPLAAGDGAAAADERSITLTATAPAEVLVFDLR